MSHHYAGHYPKNTPGPKQNVIKPAAKKLVVGDLVQIKSRNSLYMPLDEPHFPEGGPLPAEFDGVIARVIEVPTKHFRGSSGLTCGPGVPDVQWALQIVQRGEHFGHRLQIDSVIFNQVHPLEVLALGYEEIEEAPHEQDEEEGQAP